MTNETNKRICPCGSNNLFSKCCEPFLSIIDINYDEYKPDTLLLDWLDKYSVPIKKSFREKVSTDIFRVSHYIDNHIDKYSTLGYPKISPNKETLDKAYIFMKHNILMSLFGSLSCLSQGLFLQSGILERSCIEDSLVLLDISENKGQIGKYIQEKYSTNGLISRVKKYIPNDIVRWYSYFSANFSHVGPLHPAPYMPSACYADNYVLVVGIQNIVRSAVTFHIVLERIYFDVTNNPLFWSLDHSNNIYIFNDENLIFQWANQIGDDIVSRFPPDEKKDGFIYDTKDYRLK